VKEVNIKKELNREEFYEGNGVRIKQKENLCKYKENKKNRIRELLYVP